MRVRLILTVWCFLLGALLMAFDTLTRGQTIGLALLNALGCVWLERREEI